jgi:hypothetical protein
MDFLLGAQHRNDFCFLLSTAKLDSLVIFNIIKLCYDS